jgi:ribosomal protein L16 Arg81 hydroxylase
MASQSPTFDIPHHWIRWLGENLMRNVSQEELVRVMTQNGCDSRQVCALVDANLNNPFIEAGRILFGQLRKREWLMDIYQQLYRLSNEYPVISRVSCPSSQEFLENYYSKHRPVIITDAMKNWPALTKWTPEYFRSRFSDKRVEVQFNRNNDLLFEENSISHKKKMSFGEYVDLVENGGETNNYYMTANNSELNSQSLAELYNDVLHFPDYLNPLDAKGRTFFWYGPKGSLTPLHHDLTNNFMAQVRGKKSIKLISSYQLPIVYNYKHCFSEVDLLNIDYKRFPLFRDVDILEVTLLPGEILFIPVGWWHHVMGLDVTITMSFTNFKWPNLYENLTQA